MYGSLPQGAAAMERENEAAEHREALLDEALEETFPASDPVSLARGRAPQEPPARD